MLRILVLTVLALPMVSQADIIKCEFTEPLISTTLSMARNSLTIEDNVAQQTQVTPEVSFQILAPGQFQILSRNKAIIMELTLDNKGSDGMSERVYPFSAKWNRANGPLIGGCTSNFLKATGP